MNTRTLRNEEILPNVKKMTKEVDGKKVPLTEEEQHEAMCNAFNEFFKYHLDYARLYGFFMFLRDDFFTQEMADRVLLYGDVYFKDRIEKVKSGQRRIIRTEEKDINMLNRYNSILKKEVLAKRKQIVGKSKKESAKRTKKGQSMVKQLADTNYNYANPQTKKSVIYSIND